MKEYKFLEIITEIDDDSVSDKNVIVKLIPKWDIKNECFLWDIDRDYILYYITKEQRDEIINTAFKEDFLVYIGKVVPYSWITQRQLREYAEKLFWYRMIRG